MNDSMKELEKRIKNSWETIDLSEAAQQAILYNIKMHQNTGLNKFRKVKLYSVLYGLGLAAVMFVTFILINPLLHKHQNVQPNPTVQKDPVVNEAHPPKVKEALKPEYYFPQRFTDKDTVFINDNMGWKIVHGEAGGMHKEAASIFQTKDGGKTWENIFNIDGQKNSNLLSGYKMGITFINNKQGWISIVLDPDPKSPYLIKTTDGGKTWSIQYLPIPNQFDQELRQITRPVFFSSTDGMVPIVSEIGGTGKLLYMEITHDAGKTWIPIVEQSSGNLSWDFSDPHNGKVTYKNKKWETPDLGETWQSK